MNIKQNRSIVGLMGIWGFVFTLGISVPFVMAGSNLAEGLRGGQKDQVMQHELNDFPAITQPVVPPLNDSEMVIQPPDSPPDPEAVVIPPVLDPEMAVDPATRQPMTKEQLERLTPEGLENDAPGNEPRELKKR